MFKDIQASIVQKYGQPEEYMTNHYPKNYFDFFIDIGTRGTFNPWHINHLAKDNPETLFLGYEPDTPYYNELVGVVGDEGLTNVRMHSEGLGNGQPMSTPQGSGDTVTLSQIFQKHNLDPEKPWAFKSDCEGGEYSLLTEECRGCVDILKQADHISIEFHVSGGGQNFFTKHNNLPQSFDLAEDWMKENFSKSHEILLTSSEPSLGLRTYVLLSRKIMSSVDNLFWSELL